MVRTRRFPVTPARRLVVAATLLALVLAGLLAAVASPARAAKPVPLGASVVWDEFSAYTADAAAYRRAFEDHFDVLVPENEMKMTRIWRRQPRVVGGLVDPGIDFRTLDRIAAYVRHRPGARMRGHTLVWWQSVPGWVRRLRVTIPDRRTRARTLRRYLRIYVRAVVSRYADIVDSWDVANEIADDATPARPADGRGRLRPSFWLEELGTDYLHEIFREARAADPTARLLVNEIGADVRNDTSDRVLRAVTDLRRDGAPIDGVGLQMHTETAMSHVVTYRAVRANLARFAAAGLDTEITEMDVALRPLLTTYLRGHPEVQTQRRMYARVAAACRDVPRCRGFTTWGVGDRHSWKPLRTFPLLFTRDWRPKAAWVEVAERLR